MEFESTENCLKTEELSSNEIILYDALPNIFCYLNIYDLNSAAKVCKSWYYSTLIEKSKRGPQIMILQALEDFVATGYVNVNSGHQNELTVDFKNSLRIRPIAGLFFTDGKYPASADCDCVPYEICTVHRWSQPDNCIYVAIESLGINVDDNVIGGEKNITAVVFLPVLPTVNYEITETNSQCIKEYFTGTTSTLTKITDKLFSTKGNNACFIIFIYEWKSEPDYEYYHSYFLTEILNILKTKYCIGEYSLWGGSVKDIFTVMPDTSSSYYSSSFFAMSISGSSVQSWSIVLNANLTKLEFVSEVRNFKKFVQLKSSVAFLIIPSCEDNLDKSKADVFRSFFPEVKLITIFNNECSNVFSVNSINKGMAPIGSKFHNSLEKL